MKSHEQQLLSDWLLRQSEFNKSDLLVHVQAKNIIPFEKQLPFADATKIIAKAQVSIRESGMNPLCKAEGLLHWEHQGEQLETPIWITPCSFKIDRVRKQVNFDVEDHLGFANPFLVKKLVEVYHLEIKALDLESLLDELRQLGFEHVLPTNSVLGNFHHHRYAILKELELLLETDNYSNPLKHYLTGENSKRKLTLSQESLLPFDTDHRKVFECFETENCIVQGPPGTGKSQLLTNILAKSMRENHRSLVVSEKKAALEVIDKRLYESGLSNLSIVATDDLSKKDFVTSLKSSWLFLEAYQLQENTQISTRKLHEQNLQFTLDLLNQENLIGGASFAKFNDLLRKHKIDLQHSATFLPRPPELNDLEGKWELIQHLFSDQIHRLCAQIPFKKFQEQPIQAIFEELEQLQNEISAIEKAYPNFTVQDFNQLQYRAVVFQLFQNELCKKYIAVFQPNSREQRQFLKLFEKFQKLQNELKNHELNLKDWIHFPSQNNLKQLVILRNKNGFFANIKFKHYWKQWSHLSSDLAKDLIHQTQTYNTLITKQNKLQHELLKLHISDLQTVALIKSSLHLFSEEKWNLYQGLSDEEKLFLELNSKRLDSLKLKLTRQFHFEENDSLIKQIAELQGAFQKIKTHEHHILELNQPILNAFKRCETFEEFKQAVFKTHWSHFQSHYPQLSDFNAHKLIEKLDKLIESEKMEQEQFPVYILNQQKKQFENYHQLLNTPAHKLAEQDKRLKKQLQRGKRLLVKEFSKTKQHLSIREFLKSEAKLWIDLLKPVWLTNPAQLATSFELETKLFDVCIVDEASQIPVQHLLGALQRSESVVIAGDEQQMNPTSYFKSGKQDVESALHHASFYFSKHTLRHHYRSKNVVLIAFSNNHFYDQKLLVYPSFPLNENCIQAHYCEGARFEGRKNQLEARRVVELIKQHLRSEESIGVVAFSQEQVKQIWELIPSQLEDEILDRIERRLFFIKALEKVQGDECEHLIISLGYAPNEKGEFQLRFGPLNTESGKNRLNVLFSRASSSIDFVYSIHAKQISLSNNESIRLLYKWISSIEQQEKYTSPLFPHQLNPEMNQNQLKLENIHASISNALELQTTYRVLMNRGWEIQFS